MTNQLFRPNYFPDLRKLALRRLFETDQGWIMEADAVRTLLFLLLPT
jgi:hypothetical protein